MKPATRDDRAKRTPLLEHALHLAFGSKVTDRVRMFEKYAKYLKRWELTPDGEPFKTRSSDLLPVDWVGHACMIKVTHSDEERRGGVLMRWREGIGVPAVIGYKGDAIWMFRANGGRSLVEIARNGQDDEASRIICEVAAKLHRPRKKLRLPDLVSLEYWFSDLQPAASTYGGVLAKSATAARDLLSAPQQMSVPHGDLHHGNILDFGNLGWRAIDPKALIGERGFDFANILQSGFRNRHRTWTPCAAGERGSGGSVPRPHAAAALDIGLCRTVGGLDPRRGRRCEACLGRRRDCGGRDCGRLTRLLPLPARRWIILILSL
jgi:streptomycin 6-kinase